MPEELWNASGLDENDTLEMGQTLQFNCPNGLSLSFDNDGFNSYDDRFGNIYCYEIYSVIKRLN